MLKINWAKIDKFYPILLVAVLILMSFFIFSIKTIFSTFKVAYEIDKGLSETETRINKARLEEAYSFVFAKGVFPAAEEKK